MCRACRSCRRSGVVGGGRPRQWRRCGRRGPPARYRRRGRGCAVSVLCHVCRLRRTPLRRASACSARPPVPHRRGLSGHPRGAGRPVAARRRSIPAMVAAASGRAPRSARDWSVMGGRPSALPEISRWSERSSWRPLTSWPERRPSRSRREWPEPSWQSRPSWTPWPSWLAACGVRSADGRPGGWCQVKRRSGSTTSPRPGQPPLLLAVAATPPALLGQIESAAISEADKTTILGRAWQPLRPGPRRRRRGQTWFTTPSERCRTTCSAR